jgi:ABC-type transporter Mla MlaB component
MPLVTATHADRVEVRVDGPLTIMQAQDLHAGLVQAIAGPDRVEVDLSQVTEVDCAGLQLLLSLKRGAPTAALSRPSEPLLGVLKHFNLLAPLGMEA